MNGIYLFSAACTAFAYHGVKKLSKDFSLHNKKQINLDPFMTRYESLNYVRRMGFDSERCYVIAAPNIWEANRMLTNACGGYKDYVILGPCLCGEEYVYMCCDDLPRGYNLYTFVLKDGLRLDYCGVYRYLTQHVIGQIENGHWAVVRGLSL